MFGLLNLNKPSGCTSRDVVTRVARLVGRGMKVGHAGTLDPLATGVLVVCVGPATRLVPLIHEHQKSYVAEFLLGCRSDTDDIDGIVESVEIPRSLTKEQLLAILPEFTGNIQQVPPAYSAVKVNGKRAYKAARQGETFELSAREVSVTRLELINFKFDPALLATSTISPSALLTKTDAEHSNRPRFSLSIDCGTGTYIRSIGRDIARRLGTQAVMSKLIRTRVGAFAVEDGLDVTTLSREQVRTALISPLTMLEHLRQFVVPADAARRLECGQSLPWPTGLTPATTTGEILAALNEQGALLAIVAEQNGKVAPQTVFKATIDHSATHLK